MMNKKEKMLKELEKKLLPIGKAIEENPKMLICPLHKVTKKEVRLIHGKTSWRGVARATSQGKCTNQICGWFLCIDAGVEKGPWETNG